MQVYRYQLPFQRPFVLKQGTFKAREGLVLAAETSQGMQYAEIAPFPGLSTESLEDCLQAVRLCHNGAFPAQAWGQYMLHHPLKALPEPQSLPLNALLPHLPEKSLLAEVEQRYQEGYRCFKLKVGILPLQEDLQRVQFLLQRFVGLRLRLDANRSWSLANAQAFANLLPEGVDYLEEALQDPAGYPDLLAVTTCPLALDESLAEPLPLELATMAEFWVLKPMLLGPERLFYWLKQARFYRRKVVFSSVFESGLGLRYLALLAQRYSPGLAAGLDTWRAFQTDLTEPAFSAVAGHLNFQDILFTNPPRLRLNCVTPIPILS